MVNLANIGRIFYGIAIAGMGLQAIYYRNLPYMLFPSGNFNIPGFAALIIGAVFILTGASIITRQKAGLMSILLGCLFLLIVCLFYIPYEFISGSNNGHLSEWENAEKVLALAGGAFVASGCSGEKNEGFLRKLIPFGTILFALMIVGFSTFHFLYAKEASGYVPSWIPGHLFWMYFCGAALLSSGIAIILKIKGRLGATLLGIMIFIWFISLHIPRIIVAVPADLPGEITSAFLALAYCGTAFVIAGTR